MNFASRLSKPEVIELDSESLEDFKAADEVVFIGYIDSGDEASRQAFAAVAKEYHEKFTFGLVSDDALVESQGLQAPSVVCHVVEDEATRSFNSFTEDGALSSFVFEASRRVIGELSPHEQMQQRLVDVSRFAQGVGIWKKLLLTKPDVSAAGRSSICSARPRPTAQSYARRCTSSQRVTTTP